MVTLSEARDAKSLLQRTHGGKRGIIGIGIGRSGDSYCVKVNADHKVKLPQRVGNVPVRIVVISQPHKLIPTTRQ